VPTENEIYTIEQDGWIVRARRPEETDQPRTMLLIHGWTGDENVMWIFARKLPKNYWLFAPRGPIEAAGGYAWLPHAGKWPSLDEFTQPAENLLQAFSRWAKAEGAPSETFDVMGFSQGAAMSFALAALYPDRVDRVMSLAGFLPSEQEAGSFNGFSGKSVYIAHGEQDQIVPVQMAEEAVQKLQAAGAEVTYCASDTGHKLSASCLRGLEEFMR
jgi:phospholipase/carboxylesterase